MSSPERKKRKKKELSPTPQSNPNPNPNPNPSLAQLISSPERTKRKKKELSPTPQWTSISSLSHDLLLSCIARVSRLYYPTLSLVSKSFRSLTASPELYKARSLLGHTESCLYVCIQVGSYSPNWYTLCRKPNKTTKSSGYVLAKVPIPDSPPRALLSGSGLVAVGSNIYNIGGSDMNSMAGGSYSRVTILDCRSHTLSEAPSLRVALRLLSASVIDRKIYVAGRYIAAGDSDLKNSFQVLDTKEAAQVWDHVPSETPLVVRHQTASIEGKFHVVTTGNVVVYDPKQGKWDAVERRVGWYMDSGACCDIDKVLYSAQEGVFVWYDSEVRKWRNVKGLVGLPKLTRESRVKLADYGGKMAVLWEGQGFRFNPYGCLKKKIWFAEIALERRNRCEIWGKVEWLDHLLTVPVMSPVIKVLAATV